MKNEEIKTTEQLRKILNDAANEVRSGSMELDHARALLQQSKKICEKFYSKTISAMTDPEVDLSMLRKKFPSEPFR